MKKIAEENEKFQKEKEEYEIRRDTLHVSFRLLIIFLFHFSWVSHLLLFFLFPFPIYIS